MDYKLKIYTLNNIFTKKNTLFVPISNSEIHEKIIDKLIKDKINNSDLSILKQVYDGLEKIPENYIVKRVNIHIYSVDELKNYIYTEFDIQPNNQLLFFNNLNDKDYRNRILNDKLQLKSKLINEVLGFYYKNNIGKRLLNCDVKNDNIYEGASDKTDLYYEDNIILYSKNIENNIIYLVNYDNYESTNSTKNNFTKIKKLLFPKLRQSNEFDEDLLIENKKLLKKIIDENNTLQNVLDSTTINTQFFNKNYRLNNLILYSNKFDRKNFNLKEIFENFECSIELPYVRFRNYIKNNLFKIYKYGLDLSIFDRDSLKERINELNSKIKLLKEKNKFQKVLFYEKEVKRTLQAITLLKKKRNYNDFQDYLNIYDTKTNLNIDEKTFNDWKRNQILPKEFYVRENYENKLESLIFKIRHETEFKMIYFSFILYNDGGFEIKNISDNEFIEIDDLQELLDKINSLIRKINKINEEKLEEINSIDELDIKNLNCNYIIKLDESIKLNQNNIVSSIKKFFNYSYLIKLDEEVSNKVCPLKETISLKYKKISNFISENNILKHFKILRENTETLDIEEFKEKIWIPEARLKFNMTNIDALKELESIVDRKSVV